MSAPTPQTFTYSTHGVELDVYVPPTTGKLPAVILFHGGGMVSGSKRDIWFPTWLVEKALPKGIIVISANYRLLHPNTTEDIIADVHDLFQYLAKYSSDLAIFLASKDIICDADRLAVLGASGGNYAARAAATLSTVLPRPKAWISLYGMAGDFFLDHWVQPHAQDGGLSGMGYDRTVVSALLKDAQPASDAPVVFVPALGKATDSANRLGLIVHWYREGTLLDYILGTPGISEKIRQLVYEDRLSGVPEAKRKCLLPITRETSPAFLLHGTRDNIVPLSEGLKTWKDLQEAGIKAEHAWVEGAGHGLLDPDNMPSKMSGWEPAVDRALEFMEHQFED